MKTERSRVSGDRTTSVNRRSLHCAFADPQKRRIEKQRERSGRDDKFDNEVLGMMVRTRKDQAES